MTWMGKIGAVMILGAMIVSESFTKASPYEGEEEKNAM